MRMTAGEKRDYATIDFVIDYFTDSRCTILVYPPVRMSIGAGVSGQTVQDSQPITVFTKEFTIDAR